MTKTLVEKYVEDPIHMRLFQQERAIYEVTELLESVMKERGISRSQLAKLLGKSKGWVTQLLDGEANKTIRTVADAFAALGQEFRSFYRPIQISNERTHTASLVINEASPRRSSTQEIDLQSEICPLHRFINSDAPPLALAMTE
jgi:transcriptional regulator with XRE-family HTH domain